MRAASQLGAKVNPKRTSEQDCGGLQDEFLPCQIGGMVTSWRVLLQFLLPIGICCGWGCRFAVGLLFRHKPTQRLKSVLNHLLLTWVIVGDIVLESKDMDPAASKQQYV
jgi:hypothetical protein